MGKMRQKIIQMTLACSEEGRSEAPEGLSGGSELPVANRKEENLAQTDKILEEVLSFENLTQALKKVKSNKGSPGIDGVTVDLLSEYLKKHWPRIREEIRQGKYNPNPVMRKEIPKPDGNGVRKLGIPTTIDRFIQQALQQVLQRHWDSTFSENSFGFRPNRSAHDAIKKAQEYINKGFRWVVDMDLEKFFDRVNHDILMGLIAKRIKDRRVLKLIRSFLEAGIMENGLVSSSDEGTPQGGPLSPLLSNVMLDELDRELQKRGHQFVRYADDQNVYVRSQRAGERVMTSIRKFLTNKLKLRINEAKSAVDRPWNRKFLGFSFTKEREVRRKIAPKAISRFKDKIRVLTRRTRGKGFMEIVEEMNRYLRGWRSYFGYCEARYILQSLDEWIRRRLRSLIWKRWKRGRTRYDELTKRGVSPETAAKTAGSPHGSWRLSLGPAMTIAFPNAYFEARKLVKLAE